MLLSEGFHKGRLTLQRIAQLRTSRPAGIFDLAPAKGRIAVGADADLTLVDVEKERVVKADALGRTLEAISESRTTLTPTLSRKREREHSESRDHRAVVASSAA